MHNFVLYVHDVLLLDSRDSPRPESIAAVRSAYERLAITETVVGDVPPTLGSTPFIYSARKRPGPDFFYDAEWRAGEAVGVSVEMSTAGGAASWDELEQTWRQAQPPEPVGLRHSRIFVYQALAQSQQPEDPSWAKELQPMLRALVPDPGDERWISQPSVTESGFVLWDPPARAASERRIVIVGDAARESDLDRFVWTDGGPWLGPLLAYLLEATRLRYEFGVYEPRSTEISRLRREVDLAVDQLRDARDQSSRELIKADDALNALQLQKRGLIDVLADLRTLHRTSEIFVENLEHDVPGPRTGGPLATDARMAVVLRDQVGDDIRYLEITSDRAESVSAISAHVIQRNLEGNQGSRALLQTSIIGAILMALTVVQAFGASVSAFKLPLVAVLAALAFALPVTTQRSSDPVSRRSSLLRWADYVGMSALGASVGWLVYVITQYSVERLGDHDLYGWDVLMFIAVFVLPLMAIAIRRSVADRR